MVGIYNKIKQGLNWLQNKVMKNVLPYVGKLGDIVDSDALQSVLKVITPTLNTVIPGLGTGVNMARNFISGAGNVARNLSKTGGYSKGFASVPNLSKRPDQLHDRIQLKALPPPQEDDPLGVD